MRYLTTVSEELKTILDQLDPQHNYSVFPSSYSDSPNTIYVQCYARNLFASVELDENFGVNNVYINGTFDIQDIEDKLLNTAALRLVA